MSIQVHHDQQTPSDASGKPREHAIDILLGSLIFMFFPALAMSAVAPEINTALGLPDDSYGGALVRITLLLVVIYISMVALWRWTSDRPKHRDHGQSVLPTTDRLAIAFAPLIGPGFVMVFGGVIALLTYYAWGTWSALIYPSVGVLGVVGAGLVHRRAAIASERSETPHGTDG